MTPNFMSKAAKIIAEIKVQTGINEVEAEAIKELLQEELNEYCRMLHGYYAEEYYLAIDSACSSAYDNGYADGHSAGHFESHSAV